MFTLMVSYFLMVSFYQLLLITLNVTRKKEWLFLFHIQKWKSSLKGVAGVKISHFVFNISEQKLQSKLFAMSFDKTAVNTRLLNGCVFLWN